MAAREGARATASNEAHRAAYSRRTLAFEVNEGQTDDRVSFLARASRHVVLLTDDEAVVSLASPSRRPATAEAVRMRFVGARAGAETVGVDALPGKVNYIIGNDPARWRTDVPTFARVQRKDIYPGIDVVYYGTQEQLEYDFVVSPSGKVDDIRLQFDGIEHSELNAAGDLVLRTRSGELRHRRPIVYQEVGGARTPIDGRYLLRESGEVGFEVGSYDSSKPLVIDPVLSYSTYLGSAGTDYANDIAVDGQGYAYITGSAPSGFPQLGGLPTGYAGNYDAFITKLSPTGDLVFSTYLGGSDQERGFGIAVDAAGYVYVSGDTLSANFPVLNAFQPVTPTNPNFVRQLDGFAAKLTPQGNSLVYSTYLGGQGEDRTNSIAADGSGNAYIVGDTNSSDFPTTMNALQRTGPDGPTTANATDGFVVKLSASGQGVYSTYWGGKGNDSVADVVADTNGNAYVTGITGSSNLPVLGAYQSTLNKTSLNGNAAFVSKFSADGATLLYSTFLGGDAHGHTQATGIALGPSGNIFVTGFTAVTDFPVVHAYQSTHQGGFWDLFVTKFSLPGTSLDFSTYLGGSKDDYGYPGPKIAVDSSDRAVIAGASRSSDFPTKNAIQSVTTVGFDIPLPVVTKFVAAGTDLVYSTYAGGALGGFGGVAHGVGVDAQGNVYVAGYLDGGLVTTPGAFQPTDPGGRNGFVLKIGEPAAPNIATQPANQTVAAGATARFTVVASAVPSPTYQWYVGASGTATSPIAGATASSYTTPALTSTTSYWVRLSNSTGTVDSATATVTVVTPPTITTQPPSQTITSGQTATLSVAASGTAPLSYQWYIGASGTTTSPVAGATASSYTTPALTSTTSYWVRLSNSAGTVDSATATVTVVTPPTITTQPQSQTIVSGQRATLNVVATGNFLSYQWFVGTSGTTSTPIAAAVFSSYVTPVLTSTTDYWVRVSNSAGTVDSSTATLTVRTVVVDADRDGKTDLALFRPSSGTWFIGNSTTGYATNTVRQWGLTGDVLVPGDYDGDGQMDLAVYRPSSRGWYILQSSTSSMATYTLGLSRDVPAPGDYDGDGKTDPAVYHRSTGVWSILTSSTSSATPVTLQWGLNGDIPVPSDYDGDSKTDLAVFRPSTGTWYVLTSSSGSTTNFSRQWGLSGDVPVPGDYDGDGITEFAVYRPATGNWFILQSTTNFTTSVSFQWGLSADVAVPGDYDGDGKTDLAVYRPSSGTWFIRQSSTGYATSVSFQWGLSGDIPAPNAPIAHAMAVSGGSSLATLVQASDFDGDGKADLTVYRPSSGTWFSLRSSTTFTTAAVFTVGVGTDLPVTGDFDGDGKTDAGVYTPATGIWSILRSTLGFTTYQWGLAGDVPVPGDYDGDGIADLAVYRPGSGTWFIRQSRTDFTTSVSFQWGLNGDVTVPGDYDGDGVTDLAVWRPSTGTWFIRQSSTGFATSVSFQWGLGGDITVPGDYDGDGKTDLGVFRPSTGTWFIRQSSTSYTTSVSFQWGLSADTPVPSDFDGDGKTDVAVYRPSTGTWFLLNSSTNFTTSASFSWGQSGDIPILRRP